MTNKEHIKSKLADKTIAEQQEMLVQLIAFSMLQTDESCEECLDSFSSERVYVERLLNDEYENEDLDEDESEEDSE